jgi:hypothetical protein
MDQRDSTDSTEWALAAEPTDMMHATEPTEPIDKIEPAEPTDKIEPAEPIDKIEPVDPMDRMEPDEPSGRAAPAVFRMPAFCQAPVEPAAWPTGLPAAAGRAARRPGCSAGASHG